MPKSFGEMILNHALTHDDLPDPDKILAGVVGKMGAPFGRLQGATGSFSSGITNNSTRLPRPIMGGIDLWKALGIK